MNPRDITIKDITENPVSNFITMAASAGAENVDGLEALLGPDRVISFWKPTPVEVSILIRGGSVKLSVMGQGMPPVMLEVQDDEN